MKTSKILIPVFASLMLIFSACKKNSDAGMAAYINEADGLLATAAQQRNVSKEEFMNSLVNVSKFTADQNVFFPSALAVDFTKKWVTLPVYKLSLIHI